jgi:hypothetical protein
MERRLKRDPMPSFQAGSAHDAIRIDSGRRVTEDVVSNLESRIRVWLLAAFGAGALACIGLACVVCRSLYADGGYVVLGLLNNPMHYNDYDFHRSFASFIGQTPVFLGQRLGLVNISAYGGIYTFAVDGLPLLAYVAALVLARNVPRLFAASAMALAVFGFGANFTNSEGNLFLGLAWLAGVLLALPGHQRVARGIVLPALAFVLLRIYEGMLLAGPVLAAWAYAKAMRTESLDEKLGLVLATLMFAIACLIGFSGYVAPRDPGNAASFASSLSAYVRNPQGWLLLAAGCVLAAMLLPSRALALGATVAAIVLAAMFVSGMLGLRDYGAYRVYYDNRSFLVLLLPLALAALMAADLFGNRWLECSVAPARLLALLVPLVAVFAIDVLGSARWFAYVNTFCDVLAEPATASTGVARLRASGAMTGWGWTHPTLSILLRPSGTSAIVRDEPGNWQPFDSAEIKLTGYRGVCENRRFGAARRAQSP